MLTFVEPFGETAYSQYRAVIQLLKTYEDLLIRERCRMKSKEYASVYFLRDLLSELKAYEIIII